jgi:SAM-dependent methyltransferase
MASNTLHVDPSNEGQLRAWDGDEGSYWAANADRYDRSVQVHHHRLLAAAGIGTTDRLLDVGCGTGQLSRDAARAASGGSTLGVDLSSAMLDVARARAAREHLTNITFEQRDAQIYPFPAATFDRVLSRTGAMFFGDPNAAFSNLGRALAPGGRMALLAWQPLSQNEWMRELMTALAAGRSLPSPPPNAPGPFSLSDPDRVRTLLGGAGFTDIELAETRGDMWFGADADEAHRFVLGQLGWMLQDLDAAGRQRGLDGLRASVSSHEGDQGVLYDSAAWIITATRTTS